MCYSFLPGFLGHFGSFFKNPFHPTICHLLAPFVYGLNLGGDQGEKNAGIGKYWDMAFVFQPNWGKAIFRKKRCLSGSYYVKFI
jgi:hypothetical protein